MNVAKEVLEKALWCASMSSQYYDGGGIQPNKLGIELEL